METISGRGRVTSRAEVSGPCAVLVRRKLTFAPSFPLTGLLAAWCLLTAVYHTSNVPLTWPLALDSPQGLGHIVRNSGKEISGIIYLSQLCLKTVFQSWSLMGP